MRGIALLASLIVGAAGAQTDTAPREGAGAVERIESLNREAEALLRAGRYRDGITRAQQAVDASESSLHADHPQTATSLNNLATLRQAMGEYARALPLFERALAIREKALGAEHPDTAASLNNLAELHRSMGAFDRALPLYQRSLAIREKVLGPQHAKTAVTLNNLALLYESTGAYERALPLYERSLAIFEHALGAEHPDTATSLHNLAELHRSMGAYPLALPLHRRALAIREKVLGAAHPYTSSSLNNLAELYRSMGAHEMALPLYQRSLAIDEKALGAEHPDTAKSLNNLALLYETMGRYILALPLYERSLAINEKTFGTWHDRTATTLNNLAELHRLRGDYQRALPLFQRALAIRERALGAEHPRTASSLNNLAQLYRSMGAYSRALPLYERSLAIDEKASGAEHPDTAKSLNNLALLYEAMGAYERALPLYERSLAINEKALGERHDRTATALNNIAEFYRATGAYARALPLYVRSLAIREAALGADHPRTALSLNSLAELYRAMREYDKAMPLLQRALAIDERALGAGHPDAARTLNNLATLHDAMGAHHRALPLYQRALVIALARMRADSDPKLLGSVAANLCGTIAATSPARNEEAIFHCKLAVNAGQFERAGAQGLDRALRESLTKSVASPYRMLAQLLAERGRLAEAEQVLLALKDAEYVGFVRGMPEGGPAPVGLTPKERGLLDEINALADALGKVYADLDAHRRQASELSSGELALRQDRRDLLQGQLLGKLGEVSARLAVRPSEVSSAIRPDDTRLARLTDKLVRSSYGESTVVVMYVPEERVTTVLVTSPAGPVALQLPVGFATLNPLIDRLRVAIREKAGYRAQAQALHRHLVAPVEAHLLAHKLQPKTLMLYLTDRLRYLPFATLVDEDGRHLIEKYRLSVFTAAARDKADAPPIARWSITAFGSTRPGAGLSALPGVKDELDAIVRTKDNPKATLPGQRLVDEQFTREAWQNMLNRDAPGDARHSVVHVATHFQSQPGDWGKSFLLLGTGERYEISELSNSLSANLDDVDLITLSACATELGDGGDGKEFEGLGALLQKKGARAVIGTLWPVQDDGSAALMQAFYGARGEQRLMSKAQALQHAQLQLLGGQLKSRNAAIDLRHPYYWAPFILMGNWL